MKQLFILLFLTLELSAKETRSDSDSFIEHTFEITVPGFEGAYNASIITFKEGYLMAFRYDTYQVPIGKNKKLFKQHIGLVRLDALFHPIHDAKLCFGERAYDPRLLSIGDKIYLIYASAHPSDPHSLLSSHLNLSEIAVEEENFKVLSDVPLLVPFQNQWEKNWVLFAYEGSPYLEYTINPQVVVKPNLESGLSETVSILQQNISWPYGIIRGGTPALEIDSEYLGFFHSSQIDPKSKKYTYYVGAYTFSNTPPFQLTRISRHPFKSPSFFKTKKNHLTRSEVIFPCGYVLKNKKFFVSYGENDAAIKIMVLDKTNLLNSLKKCD